MHIIDSKSLACVSGGETVLFEDSEGLHVLMTQHKEHFKIGNLTLNSDGTYDYAQSFFSWGTYKSHQFKILEILQDSGYGQFHAIIW